MHLPGVIAEILCIYSSVDVKLNRKHLNVIPY